MRSYEKIVDFVFVSLKPHLYLIWVETGSLKLFLILGLPTKNLTVKRCRDLFHKSHVYFEISIFEVIKSSPYLVDHIYLILDFFCPSGFLR